MIDYAAPELAADDGAPPLARERRPGARGSPSPGPGSNLASLSCRAERTEATAGSSTGRSSGPALPSTQNAACSSPGPDRPIPRTGGSPHSSSTWMLPGSRCGRSQTMHGVEEFCEVFFDDVSVPFERTLGEVGQGWAVAMDLLPFERSTALWQKCAFLYRRLEQLLTDAPEGALGPEEVGQVFTQLFAFEGALAGDAPPPGSGGAPRTGDLGRQGPRRDRRTGTLRSGHRRARPGGVDGRGPLKPAMAHRIPLLPRRDHLRGHPSRSSATSSPDACSTSEPTA